MDADEISREIEDVVATVLNVDRTDFDDETVFGEDVPAESLDYIEMAERIEESCDTTLTDEDLETIDDVGDLKRAVRET